MEAKEFTNLDGEKVQGGVKGQDRYFRPIVLIGDAIQVLQKCPGSSRDHT